MPVFSSEKAVIESTVYINPLKVSVSTPDSVEIGTVFRVEVQISNQGTGKVRDVSATIYLPSGLRLVSKKETRKLGVLSSEKSKNVFWRVKAEDLGNYIVLVQAIGNDDRTDQFISAEGTSIIEVYQEFEWRRIFWRIFHFWA